MPGIFLISDRMPIGQAIDEILLAVDCLTPEECKDFVSSFRYDSWISAPKATRSAAPIFSPRPGTLRTSEHCPFGPYFGPYSGARGAYLACMNIDMQTAVLSLNGGTGKTGSSRVSA